MKCPNCNSENNEGAKFCKKCGTPLKNSGIDHESMINSFNEDKTDNTKVIIAVLIVVVVVLAGAFIYLQGFGNNSAHESGSSQSDASSSMSVPTQDNNHSSESGSANTSSSSDSSGSSGSSSSSSKPATTTTASSSSSDVKTAKSQSSSMKIQGGSFYTGSDLSDKTYASIYVGKENAGKDVIVQIWYSRDGNTLNHGNMVPATVHSDGYLEISSADSYTYYPDFATINLYDSNSNLIDTQSVSLSPSSGTQTF